MTIAEKTQPGGMCACLSCLWTCCSGPQAPEPVPMSSHDADGARQKKTETANSSLLATTSGQSEERKSSRDRDDSVSSTVYDTDLLPPLEQKHVQAKHKCLVLDLDETLVHSSFKPIPKPDFIIPVEIDRVVHHVYVLKRPYVDEFLLRASKHYEIVIFTASLSKYADPLLDKLDIHNVIEHRLFRESCVIEGTAYVKDLRKLNRKLKDTIIVDNSPPSYLFQPANAVPIASWFDDKSDTQLLDFCPVIETTMKDVKDVRLLLDANNKSFRWLCNQANQPLSNYTVRNDRKN
jgi:RNA polymerase II subunit A small phosphatase-like protein